MQGKGQGTILHGDSALLMEAKTCMLAVEWVKQQVQCVILHTDSINLIRFLNYKQVPNVHVKCTINNNKEIAKGLDWCQVIKVSRDRVQQAHELARLCSSNTVSFKNF